MEPFVGGDATLLDVAVYFEILLRLLVRCLLRFRCVCKEWCDLIDSCVFKDKYLAFRHAMDVDHDQLVGLKITLVSQIPYEDRDRVLEIEDRNDDQYRTLLNDVSHQIYSISLTSWYTDYQLLAQSAFAPPSSSLCKDDFEISGNYSGRFMIINHFDGIVCFAIGPNWFDITLANPALREIRKLPIPLFDLGGFQPFLDGIGFGYDGSSNEYKVVAIVTVYEQEDAYHSPYKHIGIVYRLSTNSWTILGDMSQLLSSCPFVCFPHVESIFSHGSLHWCIQLPSDDDHPHTIYRILAFNVTNESFRDIPFPHGYTYYSPYDNDAMDPRLLLVDKSTVALVASTVVTCLYEQILQVWVMNDYGDSNSWTKQCTITILPGLIRPICFWKKDKILLTSLGAELICYDLSTGQPMDEQVYPISDSGFQGLQLVTGHQSFVSVKQV